MIALALTSLALAPGCIEDPDCGVCDPDNLVLESLSGVNYAGDKIHLLSPPCEGERCPEPLSEGRYHVERIGPCELGEAALASPRGPEEFCRIAPNIAAYGLELVFNNLLEPASVEWVRRDPSDPEIYEVYDWKTQILSIAGPTTRFTADYRPGRGEDPDRVTRARNLSCIENLRDLGIHYDHLVDPAICDGLAATDATHITAGGSVYTSVRAGLPLKARFGQHLDSYRGAWDVRAQAGWCDPSQQGPDLCCNACDYEQSVNVAKYGLLRDPGPEAWSLSRAQVATNLRDFNAGTAVACDPDGDKYLQCQDFVAWVDRREDMEVGRVHDYEWIDRSAREVDVPIPLYDRLRETHPDNRPAWTREKDVVPCTTKADCTDRDAASLAGTECVGHKTDDLSACDPEKTPGCVEGRCAPEWFVTCRLDAATTGPDSGYCVDRRFSDRAAGACFATTASFERCVGGSCQEIGAGNRVSACDGNDDGEYRASECCQTALGAAVAGGPCDPMTLPALAPIPTFDRKASLPEETRECLCVEHQATEALDETCAAFVNATCRDQGDPDGPIRADRQGEYAIKFVTRRGGVVYDPAIKGIEWRAGHLGGVPRGTLEDCAETVSGTIGARNVRDGWRAHDEDGMPQRFEDYDRGLCSSSEYRVELAVPDAERWTEHVVDKAGNTLEGKSTYVFRTPDFHVVPGSGFPRDGLRIGACDSFSLRFSNKYDLSDGNLKKIRIIELHKIKDAAGKDAYVPFAKGLGGECSAHDWEAAYCEFHVVAGGPDCTDDPAVWAQDHLRHPPCLVADVAEHEIGEVEVSVDGRFGAVLEPGHSYRMFVPYVTELKQVVDPERYAQAFWDVCGMPLVALTPADDPSGAIAQAQRAELAYEFDVDRPKCTEDVDADGFSLSCDNDPDHRNRDQGNLDGDRYGDASDLCATMPDQTNTADADQDGVGNACDTCRLRQDRYNADDLEALGIPPTLVVRNMPMQTDSDRDGIGDVCDNCVWSANCGDYGPDAPWDLGDPIDVEDQVACNRDDDGNMIGDACEGAAPRPGAAGPIGFADGDDFDQDGLVNAVDRCPRQPVTPIGCASDDACSSASVCEVTAGLCNHIDTDDDRVGNVCDTCPFVANPTQAMVLGGAETDDPDGDFIGSDCEKIGECSGRRDPRPYAFHAVAAEGQCCVTRLVEVAGRLYRRGPDGAPDMRDPLLAPTTSVDAPAVYVTLACTEDEDGTCRRLPDDVRAEPGVLTLPAGCEEALEAAGVDQVDNVRLDPDHPSIAGDLGLLWSHQCFLPPWDQDFDSVHDACDLCIFDFDPINAPYVDRQGKTWFDRGAACNGEYDPSDRCPENEAETDTQGTSEG